MKVVGISGKARSGKDTVADLLMAKYAEQSGITHKYSFADPIKKACSELFGINIQMFYSGNRELILPEHGLSIRQIMQRFGTECMRGHFGEDFWIKKAECEFERIKEISENEQYAPVSLIVIPDVRYCNEADLIRKYGTIIHVDRDDVPDEVGDTGHTSEVGIARHMDDIMIDNNGTLEDLIEKVYDLDL